MIVFLIIFALFLFLYIHLHFHWKVSNEIDIPHIITPNKDKLETVADMRQPFIFEKPVNSTLHLEGGEKRVNIRKMKEDSIKVPHNGMLSAIKKEPYLSEKNSSFLKEILWNKDWTDLDNLLKPHMNLWTEHDILYGNQGVYTHLRRSLNYRNYIVVLEGNLQLKLMPPSSGDTIKDSKFNIWEPNDNERKALNDVSTILIPLQKGSIIHIPAYWWWSVKMPDFSCLLFLSYSTYMNTLSQIPDKMKKLLTKHKIEL